MLSSTLPTCQFLSVKAEKLCAKRRKLKSLGKELDKAFIIVYNI
jgi:hypothetical protein